MFEISNRRVRVHALAAATAVALSSLVSMSSFAADRINLNGLKSDEHFDRFIVKYRSDSPEAADVATVRRAASTAARALPTAKGKALGLTHLRRLAIQSDVLKSDRKLNRVEAEALMRQIAADPNVEYVEVDRMMHALLTPNDTRYGEQWGYTDADAGINAPQAWDITNGNGTVVAVIDTGITPHSDLSANLVAGYDFIGDTDVSVDGDGRDSNPNDPGDWYENSYCGSNAPPSSSSSWHGTHVAGTIAAVTNNSKGVAGVAYGAKVSPIRVLGRCGGYTSDIADAIIWASGGTVSGVPANANPAEVINMSLGGYGACDTTTQNAINGAVGRGTTVVVAAGNDANDASENNPANCNNVITVGAVDSQGKRSIWSTGFQESSYGSVVDLAAPGTGILSTLNSGSKTQGSETYASYSGTSMATPHVAGVVALMQAAATANGGAKTPAQIESLIKGSVRPFPSTPDKAIGTGIVNAKAAVDAATGTTPPPTGGTLTNGVAVTGLSGSAGTELRYTLSVPAGASNLKFVTSGGSGDADLYVKFGSAPSTSSYDCKSEGSTNAETCNITTAQTGTYHVLVRGYSTFSGLSLTGSYTAGSSAQTYTNNTDYTISDNATVDSPIAVSGRTGNAPTNASVSVNIVHTYRGDLKVDLVAPDGSLYNISNYAGGSADNLTGTFTFNLSSEALNGTWKLRVNDNASGDTGYINSWSVTF